MPIIGRNQHVYHKVLQQVFEKSKQRTCLFWRKLKKAEASAACEGAAYVGEDLVNEL